jgi:hypothetical protein
MVRWSIVSNVPKKAVYSEIMEITTAHMRTNLSAALFRLSTIQYSYSKEPEPRGPGFGWPPKRALDINQRSTGALEYWSNGKSIPGHMRVVKMICTPLRNCFCPITFTKQMIISRLALKYDPCTSVRYSSNAPTLQYSSTPSLRL